MPNPHHNGTPPMPPTLTGFSHAPDRGRGLARDFRVRWALAELGQPYAMRLLDFAGIKTPEHVALHPFGQIPTYQDGDIALFESGAILLHLAERHGGLLPVEPAFRARAISWLFAAVATVEPAIVEREMTGHVERDAPWYAERLPLLDRRIDQRLIALAAALGAQGWLAGAFSIADIAMIDALRRLRSTPLLGDHPTLIAFVDRGEARPAFRDAFDAQHRLFVTVSEAGAR